MTRVEPVPEGREDRWLSLLNALWRGYRGVEPFTWDTLRYGRSAGRMRPGALYWALEGDEPVGTMAVKTMTMRTIVACLAGPARPLLGEAERIARAEDRRIVEVIARGRRVQRMLP